MLDDGHGIIPNRKTFTIKIRWIYSQKMQSNDAPSLLCLPHFSGAGHIATISFTSILMHTKYSSSSSVCGCVCTAVGIHNIISLSLSPLHVSRLSTILQKRLVSVCVCVFVPRTLFLFYSSAIMWEYERCVIASELHKMQQKPSKKKKKKKSATNKLRKRNITNNYRSMDSHK